MVARAPKPHFRGEGFITHQAPVNTLAVESDLGSINYTTFMQKNSRELQQIKKIGRTPKFPYLSKFCLSN